MSPGRKKEKEDKRLGSEVPPFYVRVSEREWEIIRWAIEKEFGSVEQHKSEYIRRAAIMRAQWLWKKHGGQ